MTYRLLADRWVGSSKTRLAREAFVQADFDELVPGAGDASLAREAVSLFRAVVACARESADPVTAMLVLPLPGSRRLLRSAPNLDAYLSRRWSTNEQPGFYLTRPDHWSACEDVEDYRLPVEHHIDGAAPIHCYYRAFRSHQARLCGWEYTRAFYFRTA